MAANAQQLQKVIARSLWVALVVACFFENSAHADPTGEAVPRDMQEAKTWGSQIAKILGVSETTWWVPGQGFVTQLSSTQSPMKVFVLHQIRFLGENARTLHWLEKPDVQEMFFDDQPRRIEWLKKKGFVVQQISLESGSLFYHVVHHTQLKSNTPYVQIRLQVEPDFRTFVKDVSQINARPDWDLEMDPEVARKRQERSLRTGPTCEGLFVSSAV